MARKETKLVPIGRGGSSESREARPYQSEHTVSLKQLISGGGRSLSDHVIKILHKKVHCIMYRIFYCLLPSYFAEVDYY